MAKEGPGASVIFYYYETEIEFRYLANKNCSYVNCVNFSLLTDNFFMHVKLVIPLVADPNMIPK